MLAFVLPSIQYSRSWTCVVCARASCCDTYSNAPTWVRAQLNSSTRWYALDDRWETLQPQGDPNTRRTSSSTRCHIVMRTVSLKGAGGLFACARQGHRELKIIARMSAVQVFRVEVVVTAVLINLSCCLLVFVVKQFLTRMRGTKITALNIRRITS